MGRYGLITWYRNYLECDCDWDWATLSSEVWLHFINMLSSFNSSLIVWMSWVAAPGPPAMKIIRLQDIFKIINENQRAVRANNGSWSTNPEFVGAASFRPLLRKIIQYKLLDFFRFLVRHQTNRELADHFLRNDSFRANFAERAFDAVNR